MLLGDSTGKKYPPFVVFKVRPSSVEERRGENHDARHGFSANMWRKDALPAQNNFGMQVYANAKDRPQPCEPVLLLLDAFSGHWSKEVTEYADEIGVTLMKVPPNATSVCQPADATWNGLLKTRLRNLWIHDLRVQLQARTPDIPFKLQPPDRKHLCSWINDAWNKTTVETVVSGFKKCNLLHGSSGEQVGEVVQVEDAADIVEEAKRSKQTDEVLGEFSLDEDFDDAFRALTLHD
ncbi:Hypothetical protein PHPALM_12262 [Phytophthora palmivora]|uniref:DDE-1 domain-containing protein n=1 Tax=Phytophthora palmivora TaxID=4796 RepID=A0A2P4Y073_9STRA|nr:Hypothetical protein PHPALM_12262 [Phytophthora palmivora]